MTPVEVRSKLVEALSLDLIGPDRGSEHLAEVLPQPPSRWYLTGFLVPQGAAEVQRRDETSSEGIDEQNDAGSPDDSQTPEPSAARRVFFPSSMGLSLLVPKDAKELRVIVRWGDYHPQTPLESAVEAEGEGLAWDSATPPLAWPWKRTDQEREVKLPLEAAVKPVEVEVPESNGLVVVLSVRTVCTGEAFEGLVPRDTRSVSVFLVNRRSPSPNVSRDEGYIFQAALEVFADRPFVPRPNLRGLDTDDWDERVADLQYHDACEFAVGHAVATQAVVDADCLCREVHTRWIPSAEVERVAPAQIEGIELGMEALGRLADGAEARKKLSALVAHYREWITTQRAKTPTKPEKRKEMADLLLNRAEDAAKRIEAGIALLEDATLLDAFRTANRVMAASGRQREGVLRDIDPAKVPAPAWRPFQLAFLLMNLRGVAQSTHDERETVDLLFFPTGGGKTEAYLGLAAFTLVLRRLRNPGIASAGLSVLMRYTLRLLTLDQLSRAAALICALERERHQDASKLGEWPFEIGLWVGRAATPNVMGRKGDGKEDTARSRTLKFQRGLTKASPIPLENCPWCGAKFSSDTSKNSFRLMPNPDHPADLHINCLNRDCYFNRNGPLPILAVDEPIYRRLPCFLIATVDKFAAMPWTGEVGGFFGRVQRYDKQGFYGPCEPLRGALLPAELQPPDLVIQDELHLISGPMGTLVGLYETALDGLCSREVNGKVIRPKIVASTATVRRAERQILALFNRRTVDIFPPPGPNRRDSFFARTLRPEESNARLYLGVAAQGRSPKVMLLRVYLAVLAVAAKWYQAAGGKKNKQNPAEPYMTLVGYFNSLRELGGSRRIVEDEVTTRLAGYPKRKREGEKEGLFGERKIAYEVVELTSRVSMDMIAEAKRRLALAFHEEKPVDVAIATNMISVGLDIQRLGLMVVLGQPKTSAEYIQATSRVGRDSEKPGLVVTLLNVHRPRDRSHYERFAAYHQSFYRNVEATSVTPFSPRALDRGLAGTLVALARQGNLLMTPAKGATAILQERGRLDFVVRALVRRAVEHDKDLTAAEGEALGERVRQRAAGLLDLWETIANELHNQGGTLQYQIEGGAAQRLLYEFLNPELKKLPPRHNDFRANRSMRDVEPSVNLWVKTLDNIDVEDGE
jgi:hypothetical protein